MHAALLAPDGLSLLAGHASALAGHASALAGHASALSDLAAPHLSHLLHLSGSLAQAGVAGGPASVKSADALLQAATATDLSLFQAVVKWSFSATMIGMVVATVFFFFERTRVDEAHRLTITVGGLITLAASISYYFMSTRYVPGAFYDTEIRYADWAITTPLLLLKLCAMAGQRRVSGGTMIALVVADLFMIVTGYVGEQSINLRATAGILEGNTGLPLAMFVLSCVGWVAVLAILLGPVRAASNDAEPEERKAVKALILFPLVLWAVYPLGYLFRLYWGAFGFPGDLTQLMWNVGDFVNKAIYGYVAWAAIQAYTDRKNGYAIQRERGEPTGSRILDRDDGVRPMPAVGSSPAGRDGGPVPAT